MYEISYQITHMIMCTTITIHVPSVQPRTLLYASHNASLIAKLTQTNLINALTRESINKLLIIPRLLWFIITLINL